MAVLELDDLFSLLDSNAKAPVIAPSIEEANDGDFIFCSEGMYCKHSRRIGDFITLESKFPRPVPMVQKGEERFIQNPNMPKIPGYLFHGIINFYRKIYQTNRNEVMAQIWFNKRTNEYIVEVPVQRVAGASISYDRTGRFYEDSDLELVLTSHSHHAMSAYYSGTDNADEQGQDGIYSFVFGNLINLPDNKFTYKTVQRVCFGKSFFSIGIEDIFDFDAQGYYEVPEIEYLNVTEAQRTYPAYTGAKTYPISTKAKTAANVHNGFNYDSYAHSNYGLYDDYGYLYDSYMGKSNKIAEKYPYSRYGLLNTPAGNVSASTSSGLKTVFSTVEASNFGDYEINKIKSCLESASKTIKEIDSTNPLVTEFLSKFLLSIPEYLNNEGAPALTVEDGNFMKDQYEGTQEFLAKFAMYCYLSSCAGVEDDFGMLNVEEATDVIYDVIREYNVII